MLMQNFWGDKQTALLYVMEYVMVFSGVVNWYLNYGLVYMEVGDPR